MGGVTAVPNPVWTNEQRKAIRDQLERLLVSSYFSSSRRYPALLSYIVEKALDGGAGELKERTLGVEVFHRPANYDTGSDPVVRVAAGEIRKRLAQYYDEAGHESELRIHLPSGAYVPEFMTPSPAVAKVEMQVSAPSAPKALLAQASRPRVWWIAAPAVAVLLGILVYRPWVDRTPTGLFWRQLRNADGSVVVCVGQQGNQPIAPGLISPNEPQQLLNSPNYSERVLLGDAIAAARLVGMLGRMDKSYQVIGSNSATFTDVRSGPVILVAAGDNPWTMRVTDPLRYHFVSAGGGDLHVEDRQHPDKRDWAINFQQPYTSLTQDYAIIGRFHDPTTGQLVVVAAGLGLNGTTAAGEFLTDDGYMQQLVKQAPAGWEKRNMEAVIATQVIGERSGPPRVVAVYVW